MKPCPISLVSRYRREGNSQEDEQGGQIRFNMEESKMSIDVMNAKVKELRELRRMADELAGKSKPK